MKHINEIISEKTKPLKKEIGKLKRKLKLAELEFWADHNKIKRLEKKIHKLENPDASYTADPELTPEEDKFVWQLSTVALALMLITLVFYINYIK